MQALGKVTVCPSKDQVQVSRETNPKTSRQTLAKQTQPHVWVCVYKNRQRKAFSRKYAYQSLGGCVVLECAGEKNHRQET